MAASNGSTRTLLLDIDTLAAPRDFIRINGVTYDVAAPGQHGVRWRAKVDALMERLRELEAVGTDLSEDDDREFTDKLSELVRMVVPDLPDDVLVALDDDTRTDIAAAFFAARAERRRERIAEMSAQISENPSPGSPASTAAATGS